MKSTLNFEQKKTGPKGLVELPDPGYIQFDDSPLSTNLVDEYRGKGEALPSLIKDWVEAYDFHMLKLLLNLVSRVDTGARGVKTMTFEGSFDTKVKVEDIAPQTEWTAKNYSADVKLGIDSLSDVLKLVPLPIPGITTKVSFEYKWEPKTPKIISGPAWNSARWRFEATSNEYLDGGHELMILFARPRTLKEVVLNVQASAKYDMSMSQDIVYTRVTPITVNFKPSQPLIIPAS